MNGRKLRVAVRARLASQRRLLRGYNVGAEG